MSNPSAIVENTSYNYLKYCTIYYTMLLTLYIIFTNVVVYLKTISNPKNIINF